MKPAREPASSRPKPCASLKKPHESARSPLHVALVGRRMTVVRDQLFFPQKPPGSRFRFSRTGVQPSPGSSTIELPSAFAESGAYPPDRELPGSPRQCSLPLACRHPKATKLELGRGAYLKTPSSANHTAAAFQPTGRIAKAASWPHLSRVSPALHPPERPSHTHTPKPGFGGRGHEVQQSIQPLRYRFLSLDVKSIPNKVYIEIYLTLCGLHATHRSTLFAGLLLPSCLIVVSLWMVCETAAQHAGRRRLPVQSRLY